MTQGPWTYENDCTMLDPITGEPVTGVRIYGNGGYLVGEIYHADPEDIATVMTRRSEDEDKTAIDIIKLAVGLAIVERDKRWAIMFDELDEQYDDKVEAFWEAHRTIHNEIRARRNRL